MLARQGGRADDDLATAQLDVLAGDMDTTGDGIWDFHEQFTLVQLRLVCCGGDIVDGVERNTQAGEGINGLFDRMGGKPRRQALFDSLPGFPAVTDALQVTLY